MSKQPMKPTTFRLGTEDLKRLGRLRGRLYRARLAEGNSRKVSIAEALRWAIRHTEDYTRPEGSPPFPYPETRP